MQETMRDTIKVQARITKTYCPKCYQLFKGTVRCCPDDGTEVRGPKNDPLIGTIFADSYEIESVLGIGGMSVVYKARHRMMDRNVAIKMPLSNLKEDVNSLERFKQEAQAMSSLCHPNIVAVYDFGVSPAGRPFIVLDCVEGESLRDMIDRKGKVPFKRALPIFRQICDGLDAAHKYHILHRDMKPANAILTKLDETTELVKLVDFGIAKLLPESSKKAQYLTQTGEVFGSPLYMSPEQCLGRELDTRSDIYAVACLMYETLAGRPPFFGESFLDTMSKHVSEKARPINEIAPDAHVPAALEQLIMRCLSKDPVDRVQSAGEISCLLSDLTFKFRAFGSGTRAPLRKISQSPMQKLSSLFSYSSILVYSLFAFSVFSFIALWAGPKGDGGTLLNKALWQMAMSETTRAIQNIDFAKAEKEVLRSEGLARMFADDKVRLEATLRVESDLYNRLGAHAKQLLKLKHEIVEIERQRTEVEFHTRMRLLTETEKAVRSNKVQVRQKAVAEAQIPDIISTASKLHERGLFSDEEQLLTKALSIETKLLGSDTLSLADLRIALAQCPIQLRKLPPVRGVLVEASRPNKKNKAATDYVRALNKLGQYDLDQNNFKEAEPELANALAEGRQLDVATPVMMACLLSYGDLLRQTKREEASKKLFCEADLLRDQ